MENSDIRKDLTSGLESLIQRFLDAKAKPNHHIYHMGKVVDNVDPEKKGRVRVMVYQKFEGIPEGDLPWAMPDFAIMGQFNVPDVGRLVMVYFQDNDVHCPHYTTQVVNDDALSDERLEDYPNTVIFYETEEGEYLKKNKKTGEMIYRHSSGATVIFTQNGNISINTTHTSVGKLDLTIRGSANIDVTGTVTLNAPVVITPAGTVAPTGTGGLCAMPIDPLTGLPQVGSVLTRTV